MAELNEALANDRRMVDLPTNRCWLELRKPGCVPCRKGPFAQRTLAATLREFFKYNPTAKISVVTISSDGPYFQDAPEVLMMIDGRSRATALRHIKSSNAAYASAAQTIPVQVDPPTKMHSRLEPAGPQSRSTRVKRIRSNRFEWLAMSAGERAAQTKNRLWDGIFTSPREARAARLARHLSQYFAASGVRR